jgi:uncharacterized protein YkwD
MRSLSVLLVAFGLWTATPVEACVVPKIAVKEAARVVAMVNEVRQANGLTPLAPNARLQQAAQAHSCFMADIGKMTHAGAGSSSAGDRARAAGYRWRFVAENVAWGQEDAPRVVAGWGASAPHRRNILSKDAKEIGVALRHGKTGQAYWTLLLAASQ